MPQRNTEEIIIEAKGFFSTYKHEIGESIRRGKKVVFINFDDISSHSPILAEALISSPEEILQNLETALEETGLIKNPRIRLNNLPETQRVKVRTIRAEHLNQLIYFEGLVRQASDIRPQVVNAKFECPSCGAVISVLQIDRKFREPSRCSCGRKGQFRLISKAMVDAQRLVIEESPESLSGGEQPRRISVFLKEDLVEPVMEEKTTPGSKVRVLGILKEVPIPLQTGAISTRFDLAVEANNLIPLESTYEDLEISDEEEKQIQELAADPELFKKLRNSIAPSIWGYEEIKEALVLQMFSGVRKVNPNDGSVSRGDIHLFLMGDPGVAKSQVLKFVSNIAPRGRYVVGMGASGRGITATVVRDEFLKGWSLEAGAMVLANKGVVCIDEIEKMTPEDRSAMHEALEQQTVTISKANVQACYSEDTDILTEQGWKKYEDVKNLKIAQYNPKTKTIEFLPHKGLHIYNHKGKMYHFKNKRNDILVTPSHKMLIREERHKDYETIEAESIKHARFRVLNSGRFINKGQEFFVLPSIQHKQNRTHIKYAHQHHPKKIPMDLWLEFLGYYLTEGGVETNPTIGIVQKKGKNADKIEKCLFSLSKQVGFTLTKIDCHPYIRFKITNTQLYTFLEKCGKKYFEKKFPVEDLNLASLSKRQLKILYNAMMLGDGSSDGKSYASTSKELIDFFQLIACLIGKSANKNLCYSGKKRGNRSDLYRISLSDKKELCIRKEVNHIKQIKYNGKVFCFSTETGFFVTRRNGKIAIQGNSLTAQTSVLAAGNPKYGRFEPLQPIAQQIDLPPALINRFDLIFILRDLPNKKQDDAIATHVLKLHQLKGEKSDIDRELFRKYVAYAKQKTGPKLTDEAVEEIKNFYVKLRNMQSSGDQRGIPISARQLQALVRLAEAHAKTRLSTKVKKEDSQVAIRLMNYYLMQVGYDPETKTFDIDRFTTHISSSQRGKIILVKETIRSLEEKHGKMVPLDILRAELGNNINDTEFEEAIQKLKSSGDIFQPKSGFVQLI